MLIFTLFITVVMNEWDIKTYAAFMFVSYGEYFRKEGEVFT